MKTVKIKIDGQEIEVPEGITILEAAKKLNKLIPTFCYHEKLPIFGGCRICLVYDKKINDTVIACGTNVYDGLEIETMNERVFNDRKFILEMLFTRHPLDCPTCDKAGECDLQNWGTYYGPQINILPLTPFDKIRPEEDWQSSYLEFVSNRCVLCLKCTSVCDNIVGAHALFQEERGFEILISPDEKPMDTESSCEMCGLCVDVCPVGAILFKPFEHWTRAWLLKEKVTYCGMCSIQCPVAIDYDEKKQKIYRIRSTADLMVCNGAYLGYDSSEKNRLKGALINSQPVFLEEAIKEIADIINENPLKTALVLSPYSLNEAVEEALNFAEKTGIKLSSTITTNLIPTVEGFVEETNEDYTVPSEIDIIKSKKVIVVGDDIGNTTPVLSYLLKGNYHLGKPIDPEEKEIYYIGNRLDTLKKYFPEEIDVENDDELIQKVENIKEYINGIGENTVIIYSSSTLKGKKAYEIGKVLGKIKKETNSQVLIIPPERNGYGLANRLKNFHYLPDIFKEIKEGKIENLILVGEDITEHFEEDEIKEILSSVKNSIIFTQFNDGMALSCNIAVGTSLWFEENGTTEGFRGKKEVRGALKNPQQEKDLWKKLTEKVKFTPQAVREKTAKSKYYDYDKFIKNEIKLWDFGYISKRSENLTKWKIEKLSKIQNP